ncbi:hypothetical protein ACFQL9_13325 [Halobaculum lipolyticum]|uniref:Uncharacterized protein n=1 Tax=Halobaculum lipolyticum TaxID=3032001 RepID=A0ABD5WIN2_9EURY
MSDDPFADLGDTLDDGEDDVSGVDDGGNSSTTESTAEDETAAETESVDPLRDVPFTYEDAQQRPFYAREETIEDFDAWMNYELERALSERGYQNIVVREMTDALLRTVVEEDLVEEVAARFEEAREGDE